jgi:hypothetical protein
LPSTKGLSTLPAVLPSFIEPMQAEAARELPDGGLWSYEAKFDGYRCLVAKRSGGVVLWSPAHDENVQRRMQLSCGWQKTVLILIPDTKCNAGDLSCNSTGGTRRS